ncbi:MAG TPA: hypothetical protein VLK79_12665 [Gaiellales bacterium]|nr:hypothetical protein [Gaiellales bacterium]
MLRALILLGIASAAWGANLSCPTGMLTPTAQTATGASANTVTARAAPAIAFQAQNTAGTATVQIEMCCFGSCDSATGAWAVVENSPMSLATNSLAKGVANPTCQYRAYATACAGCAVTVGFACSGP